ncbi:hypothetical protein B0T09DRAFT_358910 [Sordaria sp. MPI-SDFR-AT-0083]|nr:hypothetical protein B0T09DRAFT_358910 [Sordaria sp. MPI-SDFR-AT-0083]
MEQEHRNSNTSSDNDHEREVAMGQGDQDSQDEYGNEVNMYDVTIDLGKTGVVERRGIMEVRCRSREVVHGRLEPGIGKYATLLVYDVSFKTIKKSRRVTWVKVEFTFASSEGNSRMPEVWSIAPAGTVPLLQSSQEETVRTLSKLTAGAPELLANVNASIEREKTVTKMTSDSARVIGITTCDEFGQQVGASWIMEENKALKSGVPSLIRCVMLVRRRDNRRFECNVSIDTKADWKTELGRLVGSTRETDDPVYFDPQLPPFSRLRKVDEYDLANLLSVDLDALAEIRF